MAKNPMQRKANMYMFIGIGVTLLITGAIIAILFMQLSKAQKELKSENDRKIFGYVVISEIKAGNEIDASQLESNVGIIAKSSNMSSIIKVGSLASGVKAKVDLHPGTVLTSDLTIEGEEPSNDVRKVEYNMISLDSQIESGDTIDVRLKMPNGTDYIVVSKKVVEIPEISGIPSVNTIKLTVSEEEILTMSNAIVEAYWAKGSRLYVTKYVEAGLQESATPTYLPSAEVATLMNADPNIIDTARAALASRYSNTAGTIRNDIVNNLNNNADSKDDNVRTGVEQEIEKAKQERQSYLEALGE